MSLSPGTRLGPYELEAPIGAGGMGEVYRAKDTRLDRTVAVKLLPDELSSKPGLRQRFEREARAIASLSHPNICALHDVGQQDGIDFLVMEYLEGETLADRLSHGALKTELLLRYAIQIADALDKAHRQGFVHRDLKPGNIMLTRSGVKLLDFGLAKIVAGGKMPGGGIVGEMAATATMQPVTAEGTIAGTLQYMAPEQLEGKDADTRTDIFAFGTVVYEMATGKKAFEGKSQASLIAAILAAEPKPILSLQPLAPPALERVVQTCLAKDPDERWQNAHDIMRELQWIAEAKAQPGEAAQHRHFGRERLVWGLLVGLLSVALLLVAGRHFREAKLERQEVRFSFQASESARFQQLSVSPDGRYIIVVNQIVAGRTQLLLRPLDSLNSQALPGTEDARHPFWSPDSRFIGFFAGGKLKKVVVASGVTETLCDAADGRGGTWNRDGTIVFSPSPTGVLYSVAAAGGDPTPATLRATSATSEVHRFPHFLPDGRHFLFVVRDAGEGKDGLYLASVDSKEPRRLLADMSNAEFMQSSPSNRQGYLLFARDNALLAQPFDADRLQPSGEVFPVAEQVSRPAEIDYFGFSISRTGVLAYLTESQMTELLWYDREGRRIGSLGKLGMYGGLSLSPSEKKVAVSQSSKPGSPRDIWIHELARGDAASKFTLHPGSHGTPVWSPDGSRIAFGSMREGNSFIYQQDTSGAGKEEILLSIKSASTPEVRDWSRDGRFILFEVGDPKTKFDLWYLPTAGDRKPVQWLQTEFDETQGQFSPDGRWVAYNSDESGVQQIYVRPFAPSARKWPISNSGGRRPRWSGDGKELFYIAPDGRLMVAAIRTGSDSTDFEASVPQPLFSTTILQFGPNSLYNVTADGRRFLIKTTPAGTAPSTINVVVNWQAGLKR